MFLVKIPSVLDLAMRGTVRNTCYCAVPMWWQDVQIERTLSFQVPPGNNLGASGGFSSRETTLSFERTTCTSPHPHLRLGTCENDNAQIPGTKLGPHFLGDRFCVIVEFWQRVSLMHRPLPLHYKMFAEGSFCPHHHRSLPCFGVGTAPRPRSR